MKHLLTFYGSCGHTTVEDIQEDIWNRVVTTPFPVVECTDINTGEVVAKMVYCSPSRYSVCGNCMKEEFASQALEN